MDTEAAAAVRRHAILGTLARPAQHEINNLLTVMLANLDLLRRSAAEGAPRRQLERIGEAVRRLDISTRAMLSLTRRPVPAPGPFAPAASIVLIRPLLALLLPAPGALEMTLPTEPFPLATGDAAAFEDALLAAAAALGPDGRMTLTFVESPEMLALDVALAGAAVASAHAALGVAPAADGTARLALVRDPGPTPRPQASPG